MDHDQFMDALREMFEYDAEERRGMEVADVSTTYKHGELRVMLVDGTTFSVVVTEV
ncbi:hypothetical protein [Reyranella sp.]|uniref:hypothetical protein n=1 Tax=Reyranella sp. TaxID=1929291 RepID=UPI002600ACA4|nr:hypothetical protein [Reyranella sp.]